MRVSARCSHSAPTRTPDDRCRIARLRSPHAALSSRRALLTPRSQSLAGFTPLHMAVPLCREHTIQCLVDGGADPRATALDHIVPGEAVAISVQ